MAPKLPPTLYSRAQHAMTGCSKAPWGLSVLRRGMRIFTHATTSPNLSLRQRPSRYTIRAGRNLPDKEFRLMPYSTSPGGQAGIATPACRHAVGTISSFDVSNVRRVVSEDSDPFGSVFPAGCLHSSHCHSKRVVGDTSEIPAFSRILLRQLHPP